MEKGYRYAKVYQEIMRMVCANYHMEEASFEDFMDKAIGQLPMKMRKQLESFFGTDGGINHYEVIQKKISKGKALQNYELCMFEDAMKVVRKLGTIDCLMYFRQDVKELVKKIGSKTTADVNTIMQAKWAMLYGTIIYGGPYFFCDQIGVKGFEEIAYESQYSISMIRLMEDEYESIFKDMPDGEILIPVIEAWLQDLDVHDQLAIMQYFGFKIPKYLKEFVEDVEEPKNIFMIRQLKERIFSNGPWATDGHLFLKSGIKNENIRRGFEEIFELLRNGTKITRSKPEIYSFGTGAKPVEFYRVEGDEMSHIFPYIEEIMVGFRAWSEAVDETDNERDDGVQIAS